MCIYIENTFLGVNCPFQHGINLYCTDQHKLKLLMLGVKTLN